MTIIDLSNLPTHKYVEGYAHMQCPTCGRLFTLPYVEGSELPWCIHHDSTVVWHPPQDAETDWTQAHLLTGGATPRYEHDCAGACHFIGHVLGHDLYVCPQGGHMPTIIARASSVDRDYSSGLHVPLDAQAGISLVGDREMLLQFLANLNQES